MCYDFMRIFMAKILTYQLNRRNFYTKRFYSPDQEKLPLSAVAAISRIGTLDPLNGRLDINPNLISLFKEYDCWTDFNQPPAAS